ncbi:MAG: phosphate ABC transporter permease PstA [bacterium]|nr:phosphate ABC transporter permease PstA [bacterium]
MDRRKIEENIFKTLMLISTGFIIGILGLILTTIVWKGFTAINWAMLTQTPKGGYYLGKEGGILNAILGSFYLAVGATVLAAILAIPVVLYLNVYLKQNSTLATFVRFIFDVLFGVPSIVYGAFGFAVMLYFGWRASLFAGIIVVAILILPIMARAMDEVLKMVPFELKETGFALGSTRFEVAWHIVFRQAFPGILTGILLAFGRGIGDAASVLFTAGYTDSIPTSVFQPVATLPLAIFFQLGTPFPEVRERGYAAAVILTAIILGISIVSRFLTKKFTKNIVK